MRIIPIQNQILTQNKKSGFLTADASSGDSTLTVESIVGFAVDQILLVGELGNEDSEIILTHADTSPTGSTVTLVENLTFAHTQGCRVYIIDWSQARISWSATATGDKTVLDTIDLQADQLETLYTDTTESSGYYFIQFKETINDTYSDYSDAIPWAGWSTNQVGYIIENALRQNKTTFTDSVSHDFCIDEINASLKYINGKRKKWHRLQQFDYDLATTVDGTESYECPSDMWGYSNKSILDIHLDGEDSLIYLDERMFNEEDDDDTGEPEYYTVKEGSVYLRPIPDDEYDIKIDYWKECPEVDSDADTIDMARYDMVKHWLMWKIRAMLKNDGIIDMRDGDFVIFQDMLKDALWIESNTSGQGYKMNPHINKIQYK